MFTPSTGTPRGRGGVDASQDGPVTADCDDEVGAGQRVRVDVQFVLVCGRYCAFRAGPFRDCPRKFAGIGVQAVVTDAYVFVGHLGVTIGSMPNSTVYKIAFGQREGSRGVPLVTPLRRCLKSP